MAGSNYVFKPVKVVNHTQTTASNTWTITFPLEGLPVVDVMIDDGAGSLTKMMPKSVTFPSTGTVVIGFDNPHTGQARISV